MIPSNQAQDASLPVIGSQMNLTSRSNAQHTKAADYSQWVFDKNRYALPTPPHTPRQSGTRNITRGGSNSRDDIRIVYINGRGTRGPIFSAPGETPDTPEQNMDCEATRALRRRMFQLRNDRNKIVPAFDFSIGIFSYPKVSTRRYRNGKRTLVCKTSKEEAAEIRAHKKAQKNRQRWAKKDDKITSKIAQERIRRLRNMATGCKEETRSFKFTPKFDNASAEPKVTRQRPRERNWETGKAPSPFRFLETGHKSRETTVIGFDKEKAQKMQYALTLSAGRRQAESYKDRMRRERKERYKQQRLQGLEGSGRVLFQSYRGV